MLAALGLFVFDLTSLPFDQRTRRRDWRHERAARVGVRDASQYVGPGEDLVTLSGKLLPEVAGSFAAIDTLRDMADAGATYELVDGAGTVWGGYVILAIDERGQYLLDNGVPRLTDFAIDLRRVD